MKMSELIIACDEEKLEFQNLDMAIDTIDYHHKRGTKITFGTEMKIHPERGTEKLGIVLWLDRDAVKAALAAASGESA